MSTNSIVGLVLIFAGFVDCTIGVFVVAPKIEEPFQRRVVLGTVIAGASGMIIFGGLLASGVIDFFGG